MLTDGIVRLWPFGRLALGHGRLREDDPLEACRLAPLSGNPDSIATFYLLGNDRTAVNFMAGKLEANNGRRLFDPKRSPGTWPKSGDLYPTSID